MGPGLEAATSLLQSGTAISPGNFTFSIPTTGSTWSYTGEPNSSNYGVLNSTQAAAFVAAVAQWDRLIGPSFTQVTEPAGQGTIRVAFSDYDMSDTTWGHAYFVVGSQPSANGGDIWIHPDFKTATFDVGGFDFMALVHELGHTLGLRHSSTGGYPFQWNDVTYTVMSYNAARSAVWTFVDTGNGLKSTATDVYASTPMVMDIAAVQQRYGADTVTDFNVAAGQDKLRLIGLGWNSAADVLSHATQVGADLLIDTGGGGSIMMYGVLSASLSDQHFLF